jgi:cysteine desulfurase
MLPKVSASKKYIYLDHAATTPVDKSVQKAMEPFWSARFGNPSSLYKEGRDASQAITSARQKIAQLIGAKPGEIIFTAGGTESVNLAVFGVARNYKPVKEKKYHVITSAVEHHAVLRSFQALEREGYAASYLPVDKDGAIRLKDLQSSVRPETILISIMYANNEIGTIEPVAEIGKWLKRLNAERQRIGLPLIIFHTDACQAGGVLDTNVQRLGADLMTLNGSKMYGPKQTGLLYVKTGIFLQPLMYGGGQEKDIRPGTENVPGIIGFAEAFVQAEKNKAKENTRLKKLRDYFITEILKKIPQVVLNGHDERRTKNQVGQFLYSNGSFRRLPNNVNVSIPGIDGEALLFYLDSYGIAASTGSACTTTSTDPSHVILAIGRTEEFAQGAMRFTLGKSSTKKDVDYVLKVLPGIVTELRKVAQTKNS